MSSAISDGLGGLMLKIAIIIGSTRPGRIGEGVAQWVYQVELVDLRDFNLPLLDEPMPSSMNRDRNYTKPHAQKWSKTIAGFDAFVFVTPEYNHGICGALKNAIDFLFYEWNNKAAGFVSYGSAGGVRAVEQLRLVMGEIKVAAVRAKTTYSLMTDFENFKTLKPTPHHEKSVNAMIDDLLAWGEAMKTLRTKSTAQAA
jgi:NAD(P)H-dependent FMN reductase